MNNLKQKLLDLDYFIHNEYLDLYCSLIEHNSTTEKIKNLTQRHHIIPKVCYKLRNMKVDNSESNLVNLKYSDHIIAHWYLYKSAKEEYSWWFQIPIVFMINFKWNKLQYSEVKEIVSDSDLDALYMDYCSKLSIKQKLNFKISDNYIKYVRSINGNTFMDVITKISKDEFYKYYYIENHTYKETCTHFNISGNWIDKLLKYYEIPAKKNHTAFKDLTSKYSKDFLENLYINQNLHVFQIAKKLNITEDWVWQLLKFYKIRKINSGKTPEHLNELLARVSREDLYKYYIIENHKQKETQKYFNAGNNFHKMLKFYDINKAEESKVILNYEEVYKFYIIENHSYDEAIKYFKVGSLKFNAFLKEHNICKSKNKTKY